MGVEVTRQDSSCHISVSHGGSVLSDAESRLFAEQQCIVHLIGLDACIVVGCWDVGYVLNVGFATIWIGYEVARKDT